MKQPSLDPKKYAPSVCGDSHRTELPSGRKVILVCGRFKGHQTTAKHQRERHFDTRWSWSWTDRDLELPKPEIPLNSVSGMAFTVRDPRFKAVRWLYEVKEHWNWARNPHRNLPACILCGVWRCHRCMFSRANARRTEVQVCPGCGGKAGVMFASRHRMINHLPLTVPAPLTLFPVIVRDGRGKVGLAPGYKRG